MHEFVSFNHQILPVSGINLHALSSAALYGKGIFTTLAVFDAKPFLKEKHWRRLNAHARKTGIDLSGFPEKKVFGALERLIEKNGISDARCRLTFFDESSGGVWKTGSKHKTSLLIQTAEFRKAKQNIPVGLSPFTVNSGSPLAGVKSCNYLENILALEEVRKDGYDEAIRINERNEVVSGCLANVFWFEYGKRELFTPGLKTGCLAGTVREFLMERFAVVEVEKDINSFLRDAETLFLTSSGIGIVQVSDFEKEVGFEQKPHELTRFIKGWSK